jgi:hypothetical protein
MDDTSQGWIEMPATHKDSYAWNLLWTWSKPKIKWDELNVWQRVNHFQEAKQMTRKDYLKKNIMRFRNIPGKVGDAFDILPMTFTLPGDYVQFCTEFAKRYDSDSQVGTIPPPRLQALSESQTLQMGSKYLIACAHVPRTVAPPLVCTISESSTSISATTGS